MPRNEFQQPYPPQPLGYESPHPSTMMNGHAYGSYSKSMVPGKEALREMQLNGEELDMH